MARRTTLGKRALVTGASSGIGRAIALELARQGAEILAVARREERLKQLVDEIRQLGRPAEYLVGDITDEAARQACFQRVEAQWGRLDLLVNNAGIGAIGPFQQANPARLRTLFELNFFALAECTRLALPGLARGNSPMIVNIGSILAHRGVPQMTEYCASKFAVRGFSEALRAELAPQGIEVLLVCPATTESEFFSHLVEEQGRPSWRANKPTSAEAIASATVRGIRRGSHEIFPSGSARLVYWLNRMSPRLMDWIVARRR